MWALTLLAVLQAARANPCVRITIGKDENGAKTVSKSFAITARSPEACKKNQFSGLGPTKAYVPRLLARYDQNLTFVQTWDGVPLSQKYPISEFNKKFCDLSRDYVSSGVDTNY